MNKLEFQESTQHHLDSWKRFTIVFKGTIVGVAVLFAGMALFLL